MILEKEIFKDIENVHKIVFNENAVHRTFCTYEVIFANKSTYKEKKDWNRIKILLVDTSEWWNLW